MTMFVNDWNVYQNNILMKPTDFIDSLSLSVIY
jgi:hypothetical protein